MFVQMANQLYKMLIFSIYALNHFTRHKSNVYEFNKILSLFHLNDLPSKCNVIDVRFKGLVLLQNLQNACVDDKMCYS